jgi:hypothetical protein
MPKYGSIDVPRVAAEYAAADNKLKTIRKELKAAQRKAAPKIAPRTLLKDAVFFAKTEHDGSEVARVWLHNRGIVDAKCLKQALDHVRAEMGRPELQVIEGAVKAAIPSEALSPSRRAQQFLVDYRLQSWVEMQNLTKGLAPRRSQLWQQRLATDNVTEKKAAAVRGQKQWCRRWRQRSGVLLSTISCRETLPDAELQAKVASEPRAQV